MHINNIKPYILNTNNEIKENREDCRLKETAEDIANDKDYPETKENEGNKENKKIKN